MAEFVCVNSAAQALGEAGYCVLDHFLPTDQVDALRGLAIDKQDQGLLSPAAIGREKLNERSVRGDSILWLDAASQEHATVSLLAVLDALRLGLNAALFLSLSEVEVHWAVYPPGAQYQKHLDQFSSGDQSRKVSLVLYLNRDWQPEHAGQLRLFTDEGDDDYVDVEPLGGRLVLFDSARFWHQVLPANQERFSITGWFRTRSSIF